MPNEWVVGSYAPFYTAQPNTYYLGFVHFAALIMRFVFDDLFAVEGDSVFQQVDYRCDQRSSTVLCLALPNLTQGSTN